MSGLQLNKDATSLKTKENDEIECMQDQEGILVARIAYSHIAHIWANVRMDLANVSILDGHP